MTEVRPRATKISISLPPDVLQTADDECRREGESRSELIRRALESLVAGTREKAQVAVYMAGYVAEPESDAEVRASDKPGSAVLEGSEWG